MAKEYGHLTKDIWASIFPYIPLPQLFILKRINPAFRQNILSYENNKLTHLLDKCRKLQELSQADSQQLTTLLVSKTKREGPDFLLALVTDYIQLLEQTRNNPHRLSEAKRLVSGLENPAKFFFLSRRTSSIAMSNVFCRTVNLIDVYYNAFKNVLLSEKKGGKENQEPQVKRQKSISLSPTKPLSLSPIPNLRSSNQE